MAVGAELINSIFYGLVYGSLLIVAFLVGYFVWRAVTFKHRVVFHEVHKDGTVGRAKTFKMKEAKDRSGAITWKRGGPAGKAYPQPPEDCYSVMGRGKFAQAYLHEGTAVWIKSGMKIDTSKDSKEWDKELDIFTGSQKHSYLAIEELAAKKRLNQWDKFLQMVNVGVLVMVLMVIVFGYSELTAAPKEMVDKMAPIAKSFENAASAFAESNEKISRIEAGIQDIQGKQKLPPEAPQ